MSERNLALWAAAASGVLVGAAIVATRFVVAEVPPLTLAMLRYAVGFFCLLPFMAGAAWSSIDGGKPLFARKDLVPIALLGMGQFATLIALLNFGLKYVGAAQAALIFSLFPLLTLLLSALLGHERVSARLSGGVALSILGVGVALAPRLDAAHSGTGSNGWWGELAVFASACVGAVCSVLYRPYLRRYPPVHVSGFAMLASVALLCLLALNEGWPARLPAMSAPAWWTVAFIGVNSGVGYFFWLYALKHESPTRVTMFLALNPVTAALLAVPFLGEPLTAWTVAAIGLIAGGLWLATRG
ncbi:MAG: DMT family transporter [Comamonadaceae bacterium]|nr:MAG: DMT family transporter [Comamonadaceae bacterium]